MSLEGRECRGPGVAEHPELDDPERPYWLDETSPLTARAAEVVALAVALRHATARYRAAADVIRG
ncbi:MAG: hypothetical protein AAGA56_06290 [Myxococcota bacterium]